MGRPALAMIALVALGGEAAADAGGWFQYEASYRHAVAREASAPDAVTGIGVVGARARAIAGPGALGWAGGLDLHVGAAATDGFAYQLDLSPIGIGVHLGAIGLAGVTTGIGISGITEHLPVAAQLPADAFVEVALGARLRILVRGRVSWVLRNARDGGAPSVPFGDELFAFVGLRLGRRYHNGDAVTGNGYFLAAVYSEQLGTSFAGAAIGYGIDVHVR